MSDPFVHIVVAEQTFASKPVALALLGGHLSTLAAFAVRNWIPGRGSVKQAKPTQLLGAGGANDSAAFIALTLFTGNFIGVVFARSLLYQFYRSV